MSSRSSKEGRTKGIELAEIPDKLYFSIGEVGRLCQLKPHVLRYWEQEFSQLSPNTRTGNRRYYQRKDILLVRKIRSLLYDQGYTIEGARQQLITDSSSEKSAVSSNIKQVVKDSIVKLENVLHYLISA